MTLTEVDRSEADRRSLGGIVSTAWGSSVVVGVESRKGSAEV